MAYPGLSFSAPIPSGGQEILTPQALLLVTELHQKFNKHRKELLARIPAGRFGALPEIAAVVDFLLSPDAAYMTGSVVSLDGGSSL